MRTPRRSVACSSSIRGWEVRGCNLQGPMFACQLQASLFHDMAVSPPLPRLLSPPRSHRDIYRRLVTFH